MCIKSILLTAAAILLLALSPISDQQAQAAGIQGIDVSQWQGDINWSAVKASGINYAMIRVGNVKYGADTKFAQNVAGANAAGLRVGAYVYSYATNATEAAQEAAYAIALMQNTTISFPVAIDIEDDVHKSLTAAQQHEIVNTFCSMIYAAGYQPMVYSSRNWFMERLGNTAWDQWIAQYSDTCDYPYGYTMWQASSSGSVAGIAGNVDIDYCFKDYFTTIQPNGFCDIGGQTYYFINYRKQFGIQTVGGLQYGFDGTGAMIKNQTVTDAAGNIIRYCNDGHLAIITAEAQVTAAQAQALYDQAAAQLAAAQAAEQAAEATLTTAQAAYGAAQTTEANAQQAAATYMANYQTVPTPENGAAAVTAQQQYTDAATATQTALAVATQAAADLATYQTAVAAQEAALAQAKAVNDAAQAAIVIPQ